MLNQKMLSQKIKATRSSLKPLRLFDSYQLIQSGNGYVYRFINDQAMIGQSCLIHIGHEEWVEAEVIAYEKGEVIAMPLSGYVAVQAGAWVKMVPADEHAPVAQACVGRVMNGMAQPLDQLSAIPTQQPPPLISTSPLSKQAVSQILDVGIQSINGLFTLGQGQRIGLFAGAGVGKSSLLGMITRNVQADRVIVALVGERSWEIKAFIEENLGESGLAKSTIIASPAEDSPLMRIKAAQLAHDLAVQCREQGQSVLLLMDSLTRYAHALRDVALASGEPPATQGYPASVFTQLNRLIEMAGNGADKGTLSAIYTVLVEDDIDADPLASSVKAILDGHLVLNRDLANAGHHPAIDVTASISRMMTRLVSDDHLNAAQMIRKWSNDYESIKDVLSLGGYEPGNSDTLDTAIEKMPLINAYLQQQQHEQCDFSKSIIDLKALL